MAFYGKPGAENYKQKALVGLVNIMLALSMGTYVICLFILIYKASFAIIVNIS